MANLSTEDKIQECNDDLSALKKLAKVWKAKFSHSCVGIDAAISRLRRDLTDPSLCDRVGAKVREVRDNFEDVQRIYEKIGIHEDMSEVLFQTDFNEKMADIAEKMDAIEESQVMVMSEVNAEHKRMSEEEAAKKKRDGADVEEPEKSGRKTWKLENGLKPTQKLSIDMSQVEIQAWKRGWTTFYTISQLKYAPLDTVRLLLMGVLDDNLASRVEAEVEKQDTVMKMLEKMDEEIRLRNPKIVARFQWI